MDKLFDFPHKNIISCAYSQLNGLSINICLKFTMHIMQRQFHHLHNQTLFSPHFLESTYKGK